MDRYPCPSCGALQDCMTLPRSWGPELVTTWRQLERQMPCESCEGVPMPDDGDR